LAEKAALAPFEAAEAVVTAAEGATTALVAEEVAAVAEAEVAALEAEAAAIENGEGLAAAVAAGFGGAPKAPTAEADGIDEAYASIE